MSTSRTRREYRDVLYEDFGLIVELDGRVAHPGDRRWMDVARDNAAAATGLITLRYGFIDLMRRPCLVAAQVASVLRIRGWQQSTRRCSPNCPLSWSRRLLRQIDVKAFDVKEQAGAGAGIVANVGAGSGARADEDALLADYLIRVRRAARRLPRGRREWVIGRAGDRIAIALDADHADAPDMAAILTRLGEPQQLVQSVDGHVPGDEARWPEYLAVLLLVIGGIAFLPVWVGGAVLLWASPRWQLRERLIGTLIWPGGLAGFWFLVTRSTLAGSFGSGWYAYSPLAPRLSSPLTTGIGYRPNSLFWLILVALMAVQAVVGSWLLRRARGPELRNPWDSVTVPSDGTDLSW
jgi:hypothetical protein